MATATMVVRRKKRARRLAASSWSETVEWCQRYLQCHLLLAKSLDGVEGRNQTEQFGGSSDRYVFFTWYTRSPGGRSRRRRRCCAVGQVLKRSGHRCILLSLSLWNRLGNIHDSLICKRLHHLKQHAVESVWTELNLKGVHHFCRFLLQKSSRTCCLDG